VTWTVSYAGLRNGVAPDNSGLFGTSRSLVDETNDLSLGRTAPVAVAGRANLRCAICVASCSKPDRVVIAGQIGNANILTMAVSPYGMVD